MKGALPARRGGFTLFEFAVAGCVSGLLAFVLLGRLYAYWEGGERVAVQHLIATLRTALAARSAQLLANGDHAGLERLKDANPIELLQHKPDNYVGEYYWAESKDLPAGSWVFNRSDKSLMYFWSTPLNFSDRTSIFLKFKVEFQRLPRPDQDQGGSKVAEGLSIEQFVGEEAVNSYKARATGGSGAASIQHGEST